MIIHMYSFFDFFAVVISNLKGGAMERERVIIIVEVDLDPVPGWGNDPEDYVQHIQRQLDGSIPHYNPVVKLSAISRRNHDRREAELERRLNERAEGRSE